MFYFHLIDDGERSPDLDGTAFPSFELAYLATHRAAQDMSWEMIQRGKDPRTCAFEITDATARPLAFLPFAEVLNQQSVSAPRAGRRPVGRAEEHLPEARI